MTVRVNRRQHTARDYGEYVALSWLRPLIPPKPIASGVAALEGVHPEGILNRGPRQLGVHDVLQTAPRKGMRASFPGDLNLTPCPILAC